MALFYFNHDNNKDAINSFFENLGATRKWSVDEAKECKDNDLIFVHLAEKRDEWCKLGNGDVYVVFMSTDIHTLQPAGLNNYVHNCEFPADRLTEYPQIEKFIKGFPSSHQWDLLKRRLFPEALTAAYLLMVARDKKIDVRLEVALTPDQWNKACEQYHEVCKQLQESSGDTPTDWSNISKWDENEIGKVKKKIGDRFLQMVSKT